VVNPFSNSTACGAIANGAYGLCKQFSQECPKKMHSLESVVLLISIPLMIVAFSRLIGAAAYGGRSFTLCCRRLKERKPRAIYVQVSEDSRDSAIYHPTSAGRIAKLSHQAFAMLAVATALASIAYVMVKLPMSLDNKYCPDNSSCISWGNQSYQGCEVAQEWLVEVIKELVQGDSLPLRTNQ
jgi:hypothetical protein